LNAKAVFVTQAERGYTILRKDGTFNHLEAWHQGEIGTDLGAGDALFAALCAGAHRKHKLDGPEVASSIREWVTRVLQREQANLLDVSVNASDAQRAQRNTKAIAAILLLTVALVSIIVGTFYKEATPILFWSCFFGAALCGGAIGGLTRQSALLGVPENKTDLSSESIAYGTIAGIAAALAFLVPHLSIGDRTQGLREGVQGLNLLILWVFPVSLASGLALESVIDSLRQRQRLLLRRFEDDTSSPMGEGGDK
jgi:hypothetical protein